MSSIIQRGPSSTCCVERAKKAADAFRDSGLSVDDAARRFGVHQEDVREAIRVSTVRV